MAFIPCPNTIEAQLVYTMELEPCENVYHMSYSSTPTQSSLTTLAGVFTAWETAHGSQHRSTQCALHVVRLRDIASASGQELIFSVSPAITGINASDPLPNNCTIATAMRTGLAGRSNRGRGFWIGMTDSMVSANSVVSSIQTAILGDYAALLSALGTNGTPLVVLSKYHGTDSNGKPIPRSAGVTTPVISFSMDVTMDSQRRRLPGHNRHR